MEVKQEFTSTKPQLSENGAAVPSLRTMQDGMSTPMRKSSSQTMTIITTAEEAQEVGINSGRKQSFEKKLESPSKKTERKSKSTSARFLVDIEELFVSSGGSFSETESILSKASSTNLDFSFTLPGATAMPANDISDALRLKNHNCEDNAMIDSPTAYEDDLDSGNSTKIQIEPTVPIFLKFLDVKYKVVVKGSEKSILDGVTGAVHPGEVLALMGPSGGGKTTLLNLLSGRLKVNEDEGCITYNDQPYSKSLKRRIGFVLQDDVAFPHLTVKETLTYAALLRLPNTLSKKEKQERAMNVISDLGLERCQNTIIGGTFVRGISGGERKRVCIGNEILINPSLLFLDEPTSGLDSTTALRIVHMLHNIAEAGKTVVTTIHQPSSRLFNKFDKLILLGKGNSLYFGKASEAMLYFSSIGCSPLIAMNPAEFLIDLANGNINDKSFPTGLEDNVLVNSQEFRPREEWPSPIEVHEYLVGAYETKVAHIEKRKLLRPVVIEDEWEVQGRLISREWGASWCQQYSILFWRGLKVRRHDYLSCVRVIQVIVTAVILGLLWWHNDASSPKKLQDQAGLLFFISVFWGFFPVFTAIFTFPQERAMLVKERSVDMYKLSAYFLARNMSDLPLDLVLPVVFLVIVYFMVGLKLSFWAFFLTLLTVFLSIVAAQGLGLAIGAALMDVKKATTLASVIVMTFMLVGGFFIQRVPSFISWIRYVSFNYHTYRLLLRIQYSCSGSCKSPPFIQGHRLGDSAKEVGAMIAMIFGYRLIAYLCLRTMKLRS